MVSAVNAIRDINTEIQDRISETDMQGDAEDSNLEWKTPSFHQKVAVLIIPTYVIFYP